MRFSALAKDKVNPKSMFNGYDLQMTVFYIIPFLVFKNR
jgi:hypothetical protein